MDSNLDCDAQLPWSYQHSVCYICNGYYGPSFDDPVCATCHTFLFPGLVNQEDDKPVVDKTNKADDSKEYEALVTLLGYSLHFQSPCPEMMPDPVPLSDLELQIALLSEPREPDIQCNMIQQLPLEVLLAIFDYLDDLSLCSAASVCTLWRFILDSHISSTTWQQYTSIRWPLFNPIKDQNSWFKTFSALIRSCSCHTCLAQIALKSPVGNQYYVRRHRLQKEFNAMISDPVEGIKMAPLDQEFCHWQASITGPEDSPYEGGIFYLYIQVPVSYPLSPPSVRFLTRIIHPNVSRHGDVGLDIIQHNWSLTQISKILLSLQSLLTDPYTDICMEPLLGVMYQVNRKKFEHLARIWTRKFAMTHLS